MKLICFLILLGPLQVLSSNGPWGANCVLECRCYMTTLVQTIMSRWLPGNKEIKAAFCVVGHNTNVLKTMKSLPGDTEALTVLQTADAPYVTISHKMTSHLVNLKGIDFQGAGRKQKKLALESQALHNLHQLQFVSLVGVNLAGPETPFANVSSLECLQMVHCEMPMITWRTFEGLPSLQELYIVQSGIVRLENLAFSDTPQLRRVSLSHNTIASIRVESFAGLFELELLDLSNNLINRLSALSFPPLPKLQVLELKHNPIRVIFPNSFRYLNATQRISLGHNKEHVHLTKFSFEGLSSLIFLKVPNIDNDVLLEHMFYGLDSLMHLMLHGKVTSIADRAFMGVHRTLEKLVLHDCRIKKLSEEAFHGLYKLKSLDLSNNQLKTLPEDIFEPLESLEELILSQNELHTLPQRIFRPMPVLHMLRLDANPWNCSCSMTEWNEKAITQILQVVSNPCSAAGTAVCAKVRVAREPRIMPQCEYPESHRGENVFEVLHALGCHLKERD